MPCRRQLTTITLLLLTGLARADQGDAAADDGHDRASDDAAHLDQVALIVPEFSGASPLGRNVATFLNLKVWRTLRKEPHPNPGNVSFGEGIVMAGDQQVDPPTIARANEIASLNHADLVLWGNVQRFGDGVVVQAFLSAPGDSREQRERHELWTIRRGNAQVQLDLPRRVFDLGAVTVRQEVVDQFSLPSALRICPLKSRRLPCSGPEIGNYFRALTHDQAWSKVEYGQDSQVGWFHVPELSRTQNEIADFAGALVAYYRGDFQLASRYFGKVLEASSTRGLVRQDALLLKASAESRFGRNADALVRTAIEEDPYSRYALQVSVMSRTERALRGATPQAALDKLSAQLELNKELFNPSDPWLVGMRTVLGPSAN